MNDAASRSGAGNRLRPAAAPLAPVALDAAYARPPPPPHVPLRLQALRLRGHPHQGGGGRALPAARGQLAAAENFMQISKCVLDSCNEFQHTIFMQFG